MNTPNLPLKPIIPHVIEVDCETAVHSDHLEMWSRCESRIRGFSGKCSSAIIVFDLKRLKYIDAAGVKCLMNIMRLSREQKFAPIFVNAQEVVRNALIYFKLDQILLCGGQ